MEQRILYLEQRLADQGKVIVEKDRMIGKLSEQQNEMQGSGAEWPESVEITGLVEVEGGYADPYEGDSQTDAVVATVELGVAAQVHDWVSGEILFLFEEDENDDNIDVDTATLTIAPPDGPWFITGGRMYLPFGVYETTMVSDPLTLELGEIRETAVMFGFEGENLYGSAFLYNGDNSEDDDNRIDNFGAALGYAMEGDGMEFGLDVAYINDIGDTDTLQDAVVGNLEAAGAAAFDAAIAGAREMARRTALDNFSVRTEDEYRDDARRNLTYGDFRAAFYANNSRATWAPATIYKDVDANGDETYVTSSPSKSACSDMVTTDCQVDITYPSTVQNLTSLDPIYTANEKDDDIGKYYDALRVYAAGIDAGAETATPEDKSLKTAYERLEATVASGGAEALTVAEATRDETVETAGEDAAAAIAEELGEPEPETYTDTVSGIAASARWRYGDVALMAEYLGATERFQSTALAYGGSIVDGKFINRGAKPSSWMVEAALRLHDR